LTLDLINVPTRGMLQTKKIPKLVFKNTCAQKETIPN
jgi:hypothetical protein